MNISAIGLQNKSEIDCNPAASNTDSLWIRIIINTRTVATQQPPAKAGGLKLRTESPDTGR
ncbi:hypothetical protein, partial [Thiorhodococcus fuscus]